MKEQINKESAEAQPALAEVEMNEEDVDMLPWFMLTKSRVNYKGIGDLIVGEADVVHKTRLHTMDDTREIYMFKDGHYVNSGEQYVEMEAQRILDVYTSIIAKGNVIDHVQGETFIARTEFNKEGPEINLSNVVYNTETGQSRKATCNDLFTYKYPIVYNPDATCPLIMEFLARILEPDDAKLIIEEIAYCFMSGQPFEKLMAWVGEGQNGKTTLLGIIDALFNKENISYASMQQLGSGGAQTVYYQANLYGKAVNLCGDMSEKAVKYSDFIKKATSSDPITVRHAYGRNTFNFVNNAKFIFAMNEWPEFNDTSDGFFRRIMYTEFNALISEDERVPNYHKKLTTQKELSGFFNVLMDALREMKVRGRFCKDTDIGETRAMMSNTESIDDFIAQTILLVEGGIYFKSDLYDDYKKWCGSKIVPMFKSPFFRHIKTLNLKTGERKDTKGKRKNVYLGIIRGNNTPKVVVPNMFKSA